MTVLTEAGVTGRVGESPVRPDGQAKVTGAFAYASDLWLDGMLWGATLRSPHPSARIDAIDISAALAVPGVASRSPWWPRTTRRPRGARPG